MEDIIKKRERVKWFCSKNIYTRVMKKFRKKKRSFPEDPTGDNLFPTIQ